MFPTCGDDALNKIYDPKQERKRPYDPDELTDIEKRVLNLARNNQTNQRYYKDAQMQRLQYEAQQKQVADELYWQRAARATAIHPHKAAAIETTLLGKITQAIKKMPGGIEEFLVNGFNQNVASIGLKPGLAESVRTPLIYNRRIAEGVVENTLKMRGMQKLREITKVVRSKAKELGVSKDDIDETMALAVELSQLNARRAAYGIGSPADVLNVRRIEKLRSRLGGMGFNQFEVDFVFSKAIEMGDVLQEGRALALAFDVNLGYVDNLGYFMRLMQPNAKAWFDNVMNIPKFFDVDPKTVSLQIQTAFNKSRNTFFYTPQDHVLLAHKLGIEPDELLPLLDEPKEMTSFLHKQLTSAELDDLVDTGLIAKLPMTMDEVFEYLVDQYGHNLPFKGMKDVFLTDPDKAAAIYANGIQRAVGESGMIRTIFKDGIDNGWGVSKMEFDQMDVATKTEFRLIEPETIKKYIPDYQGTETMYVHRLVHDTWKSITDIAVDPAKHGAVAGFFNYVNSIFTRSLLATPQFVMRTLYSSTVAVGAAGGNLSRLPEAFFDIQRVTSKGIDAALDNTKKLYKIGGKALTEKELFEEFLYTLPRGYSQVAPGAKTATMTPGELAKAMFNMGGQANFYWQYSKAFFGAKPGKVAALWADAIKQGNDNFMASLMTAGSTVEMGARWATFKSLTDTRASSKIGSFISGLGVVPREFADMKDLARHVNEYFIAFDDVGSVTSFTSRYIRPFAIYAMNNPPATIRHIIRNPHAFINYARLRSVINSDASKDEDVSDASVPDYVQKSGPLFLYKDGEKWITLLSNNFDQISDASSYIFKEVPEDLQYMFGFYAGNTEKQRSRLQEKVDSKQWFQRMVQETLPIYRNGAELFTGIDSSTGRPIDIGQGQERESFLFWQPPAGVKWLLSSYAPLAWLDRVNPGEIFGSPASTDTRTGKVIPGFDAKRGLFGSVRTQRQVDKYDPAGQSHMVKLLRLGGFQVKILDVAREHQKTWQDITQTQTLLRKEMSNANKVIRDNPNLTDNQKADLYIILSNRKLSKEQKEAQVLALHPSTSKDYVRRAEVAVDLLETWVHLEFDRRRVEAYMLKNNIPPREVMVKLRDVNIEEIPPIEDIAGEEILKQVANEMGLKENGSQ